MGCACGKPKSGGTSTWKLISPEGKIIKTYSSEMDARMEVSRTPGSRVRPA